MTTQYKYLIKPDIVQKGDEFKIISNQDVWAPSFRVGQEVINGRYRRPIAVETKQKDCGSITEAQREIIDYERDKRNLAVIAEKQQREENDALKSRLENALKDKEVAVGRLTDIVINMINDLGDKGIAIAELTETISEHRMTNRRLEDRLSSHEEFMRQIAQALGMWAPRISFQDVLERVKSLTSRNKSHLDILNKAEMLRLLAEVELESLKTALKKLC